MKNTRRIFYISAALSVAFTLLTAVISCSDPFSASGGKETSGVIIRIAGSDGRTILPQTPIFSKYELLLQKEGEEQTQIDNTEGIDSNGVRLNLSAGNWTITLKAYQEISEDYKVVLAAVGIAEITVDNGDPKTVLMITLKPVPINEADSPGLFSFNITLPQGVQDAVLKLENESDSEEFNLIANNTGSIKRSAGYYDMSILLNKNGQNAGLFESVHIYSGLISHAEIDLSGIVFVDKVYLTGTLGGVRLGTIQIFDDNNTLIKELNLDNENKTKAVRTDVWFTDIPSSNIGKTVHITREFNGEKATIEINPQAAGKDNIVLNLAPSTPKDVNVASWYSTAKASGGENPQQAADDDGKTSWDLNLSSGTVSLELDYGFPVTINDAQVIFSDGTSPQAGGYSVKYWNGATWVEAGNRTLKGSQGIDEYGCYFNKEVTATKFQLTITGTSNNATIAEFGLSNTTGREPQLLQATGSYHTATLTWKEPKNADAYRMKSKYTSGGEWTEGELVMASACERDASNNLKYPFQKPVGYNDALKAGLELQFMVEAVNTVTEDCIPSKEDVRAKLIGPALLEPTATRDTLPNDIKVTWDKVEGAGGYYVFRRQFDMNNNTPAVTPIAYYVSGSGSVTGKGLAASTVKATASVSGSTFTLTDTQMTDGEYSGDYSAYGAYRDQQNELAWGKPYRYFIVPVHADENSISYTGGSSYTLQGVTVENANGNKLETTGSTIGFGRNVTATKGSHVEGAYNATSNNVNNGIKITWEKPPLFTGSAQYTLYRRTSGTAWITLASNLSATSYEDNLSNASNKPVRATVYEYTVSVNGSPATSARFNPDSRAQGYMLDSIKVTSVSRGEDAEANAVYGERVTWETGAVLPEGYTIYVVNRNISDQWYWVADDISADQPVNSTQNFIVKPNITATAGTGLANVTGNSRSVTVTTNSAQTDTTPSGNQTVTRDLLFVLRDYKHFFKVRSYVNGPNGKVYCPDPAWTYTRRNDTASYNTDPSTDPLNNAYVKWGARQITTDEFIRIASVFAGRGICWSWKNTADNTITVSNTVGGGGSIYQDYQYQSATDAHRVFTFTNFKADIQTRAGQTTSAGLYITFITIHGKIWSRMYDINDWPFRYGEDGWVDIKGPLDTPLLYTGQIIFGKNVSGNYTGFSWNGNGTLSGGTTTSESGNSHQARVAVKYPGTTAAEQQIPYRGRDTALQFDGQGAKRFAANEWW